jgi:hypothetical protein
VEESVELGLLPLQLTWVRDGMYLYRLIVRVGRSFILQLKLSVRTERCEHAQEGQIDKDFFHLVIVFVSYNQLLPIYRNNIAK